MAEKRTLEWNLKSSLFAACRGEASALSLCCGFCLGAKMKRAFRAVLLAGAAIIGLSSSAQAFLVQAPYITETQFDYTVHNVSASLYVWGFIISHQPATLPLRRSQIGRG